jgi:hypothetical protein
MKQQLRNHCRFVNAILVGFVCLFLVAALANGAQAQERYEPPPLPIDPTPLAKLLSESERAALAKESNAKKQVELYLRFSETHLEAALSAINQDDHTTSEHELDIYNKSLNEAGKIAFVLPDDRRKTCKKVEQVIYRQLHRLDTIDRRFPAERAGFIEYAIKNAKQVRGKALNLSFDSGEVITDPDKAPVNKPPQEKNSPAPQVSDLTHPHHSLQAETALPAVRKVAFRDANFSREAAQVSDDYLTEEEDDYVRQAQEPDLRIKVFMKIIDRRLKAITNPQVASDDKKAQKNKEEEDRKWGALPKLDRAGYLKQYSRAIDEAMAKLDDAYERNPKASSFIKALKNLLESTDEHLKILHSLENVVTSEAEKAILADAIEKATIAHKGAEDGLKAK